jgi:hypothetical protein
MLAASPLVIRAGATAARRLREEGFHPDLFGTLVGASGGPKWLVLRALDRFWAERLLPGRTRPIDALGSSIGSFRHACLAQSRPLEALERLEHGYVEQAYEERRPSLETVSAVSERIVADLLGEKGAEEVAGGATLRSHVTAVRALGGGGVDRGARFKLWLWSSAAANVAGRRRLGAFFERGVFGPAESAIAFDDLPTAHHALRSEAVLDALMASGSIPSVMAGVPRVGDASGIWFDGGIVDYHFDFRFRRAPGLVLFPHFFDRIVPGWYDKPLPWRRPSAADLDDVVMVAPSDAFVKALPGAHVPDRGDFVALPTADRIRQWRVVLAECEALADAWCDLVDGGGLADAVVPFQG